MKLFLKNLLTLDVKKMACLFFLLGTQACYVTNERSIHQKQSGPITQDIFNFRNYDDLEKELAKSLKRKGRYRQDFEIDKQSLPANGSIEYITRNASASALSVEFEKFSQKCSQRSVEDFVQEENKGGSVSTAGLDAPEPAFQKPPTQMHFISVYTLTCKPQLKIQKPTRVTVLDSADRVLKEYQIRP